MEMFSGVMKNLPLLGANYLETPELGNSLDGTKGREKIESNGIKLL